MEKKRRLPVVFYLIFILLIFNPSGIFAQDQENNDIALLKARQLLNQLSPEEKVGQLFLVSFEGSAIEEGSPIYDLITNYFIGGVVLTRENNNFVGPENIVDNTRSLNRMLQEASWQFIKDSGSANFGDDDFIGHYVPLFITIAQEGDSYPYDEIIGGITSVPNQMAIGATFDREVATQVGQILGEELQALGFNMIFGPALDVLDISYIQTGKDLGTRTFGGDPYWVSELGKAYIKGLHEGSNGKLVVVAKHFPGRGSSDRMPGEEIATVRKSLEQLKLIELTPFFEVTNVDEIERASITDALLTSHIRYQGLQGNIRATTKPVSMDASALNVLMNLEEFSSWRKSGGVLISDNLGSAAVRKFFDPRGQLFEAPQIILNAFLAGNDILYIDQITSTGDLDSFKTITSAIQLFTQKYREDTTFATRVDAAVERVLSLKYRIYANFILDDVIPSDKPLSDIEENHALIIEIARKSVTALDPMVSDISPIIPSPPSKNDRIVFLVDSLKFKQCEKCEVQSIFSTTSLQEALLSLYGPMATNQINPARVFSYSYDDLVDYLENPNSNSDFGRTIANADWIVAAQLDFNPSRTNSNALKRLITERLDLVRDKKFITFAFNAPYFFDATDIASFSAYYGLYSKLPDFVSIAIRVLMQEISPEGSSPVTIPGTNYDLMNALSPDPKQVIRLYIDQEKLQTLMPEIDLENLLFRVGETLPIRTGVIIDKNGNHVPDGTVVKFQITRFGETQTSQQIETVTKNGISSVSISIQSYGRLEVMVSSEPAYDSEILILDIASEEGGVVSAITPTPAPTQPRDYFDDGHPTTQDELLNQEERKLLIPKLLEWLVTSTLILSTAFGIWSYARRQLSISESFRIFFIVIIIGYIIYIGFLLRLPNNNFRYEVNGLLLMEFSIVISMVISGLVTWKINEKR